MKGHLTTVIPLLGRLSLPFSLSRDQVYLLFIVLNELLLGLETYLAHSLNGTVRFGEWIPVASGPIAGIALLAALALGRRKPRLALVLAVAALLTSLVVGSLGTYFHFVRAIRPSAAPGERVTLALLVWGAPLFAPPAFVIAGLLGLVALSNGEGGSGALTRPLFRRLPLTKDHAYFLLVSLGVVVATVSSLFDHLRGGFENPWLWVPLISGIYGATVALALAFLQRPGRADLTVYLLATGLLIVVGPLGLVLHVLHDLGVGGALVFERFLRGAPILAPMVFANFGLMGLLALWDPQANLYRAVNR